ncbi:hypothetical protein TRIATDRAFT_228982 [Trichoderma atroviride IMI 206040]|uniref:Uncharacterized protein n=1 Tax=Hypocrea atroviridis (strain ATCC 20476 / IMI 206040) TaxID=452589 RepID=G9P8V5_HYPAI|nr:uncharacterized protein TRIATDRAFT_228982 [Trichoderma atroviride IMI 206040]EHK41827.1 hypothetical protein TRIATDRAFT_228982 [Trichoderma atroviride IMI 206040]
MASADPLNGLKVSISQTKASPPTIIATVKNNNPHLVTIAEYQSPFDQLILELGNLAIYPGSGCSSSDSDSSGSSSTISEPLDYPTIRLKRAWPPPKETMVTLGPGESQTAEIVLRDPVPLRRLGSSATVKLSGQWMSVWRRRAEDIDEADWDDVSNPDEFSGQYESNSLEISIA